LSISKSSPSSDRRLDMSLHLRRGSRLVIATHNLGKLSEFRDLLEPFGIEVLSASGLNVPEPAETGETFEENTQLQAECTAFASALPAFSDDSGLAVEAVGGAPGIHSARWGGEPRAFGGAMARVEAAFKTKGATGAGSRRAKFVCVLCL